MQYHRDYSVKSRYTYDLIKLISLDILLLIPSSAAFLTGHDPSPYLRKFKRAFFVWLRWICFSLLLWLSFNRSQAYSPFSYSFRRLALFYHAWLWYQRLKTSLTFYVTFLCNSITEPVAPIVPDLQFNVRTELCNCLFK